MPDPAYRVARRVARDLAGEHGLTPPFDVERVARGVAEVIDEDIPTHADVIVLHADAPGARPRIVVHESLHGAPERRRFALAHGIGHVLLGWHPFGTPCDVAARPHELPVTAHDLVEGEANAFARELLVPEAWVRSFDGLDRPAVLIRHVSERGGVGLMPAARAVALLLPRGHVWAVTDSWGRVLDAGRSPGTNICAPHMGDELDAAAYARPAAARHRDELGGCAIYVWHYEDAATDSLPHDRTATEVALRIGVDLGLDDAGTRTLVARVDGVAGWANEQLGTASLEGMTRVLSERASMLPELAGATEHPAFGELLEAKATELVAKRLAR